MIDRRDEDFEEPIEYWPRFFDRWFENRNGDKPKQNGLKFRSDGDQVRKKRKKRPPDKDNSQ